MLFFIAVLVLALLIVRPFISTLLVTAVIAYVLHPVYRYFRKVTGMPRFSSAILLIMVLLVALIPLSIIVGEMAKESYAVYAEARGAVLSPDSLESACSEDSGLICGVYRIASTFSDGFGIDVGEKIAGGIADLTTLLLTRASDFLMNIPKLLLHLFISLFAMYYMFVQGESMLAALKRALPLRESDSDRILGNFNDVIYATIYGAIVIALVQGVAAGIGYAIFGAESPILLALLTLVAAFIPFLGAALVWLPVSVSMLVSGLIADDRSMMLSAGGLVIYCALFVSTLDNFLRPKIVGERANIHPLVILLGVFGGLALFGFAGVIIGPLMLTLFIAALKIYEQEKGIIL
jgi:predicted PurR-regulated permease PerM